MDLQCQGAFLSGDLGDPDVKLLWKACLSITMAWMQCQEVVGSLFVHHMPPVTKGADGGLDSTIGIREG